MISAPDRENAVQLIEEAMENGASCMKAWNERGSDHLKERKNVNFLNDYTWHKDRWRIMKRIVISLIMIFMIVSGSIPVNAQPVDMKQKGKNIYVYEGGSVSFKKPARKQKVRWTISNKKVASISQDGKVKAVSAGKTWVKARWGKNVKKKMLIVLRPYIKTAKESIDVDEKLKCRLVGAHSLDWKVSDESIASVSNEGVLTGHKTGTVVVHVKAGNKKIYSKKIEVYNSQRLQGLLNNKKLVSHRGYNIEAPENTMSAFEKSYEYGYKYIETDVTFTADGVPVLLHDDTVDRTSNGTGNIRNLSFSYVRSLDFGSWKDSEYSGEKIPTFDEFMQFCSSHDIHPYLELKSNITQERAGQLISIIDKYNMRKNVSWVSFSIDYLEYIKNIDDRMELGINTTTMNEHIYNAVNRLKSENNIVFLSVSRSCLDKEVLKQCKECNIPIGAWIYDSRDEIFQTDSYVSVITTNCVKLDK